MKRLIGLCYPSHLESPAEQHLIESLPTEKGRDPPMVAEVTGVKVLSLYPDISTTTGEEVVLMSDTHSPSGDSQKFPTYP